MTFITKYLSYIIVNDEVKLTWFDHTIFSKINAKIICGTEYLNKKFKIVKELSPEGYPKFDKCHFTYEVITYDKVIKNEAKPMYEYDFNKFTWTLDDNKKKLYNFLKEYNQEKIISLAINKIRLDKLNRICK